MRGVLSARGYRSVLAAACTIAVLGLGGAEALAQSSDLPSMGVQTVSFGQQSLTGISLELLGPASVVDVHVPRGGALDLSRAPGSEVGYVTVFLGDTRGSSGQFASGDLVADDPASASADSGTCAPGTHAARWHVELPLVGRSALMLVVYVDTPAQGDAAAVLRVCPVWDATGDGSGVYAALVSFLLEDVVAPPASPGVSTWRAFVEPARPAGQGFAAEPGSTFELRSIVAYPHTITLTARHETEEEVRPPHGTGERRRQGRVRCERRAGSLRRGHRRLRDVRPGDDEMRRGSSACAAA
jgi:hypothetical protein